MNEYDLTFFKLYHGKVLTSVIGPSFFFAVVALFIEMHNFKISVTFRS